MITYANTHTNEVWELFGLSTDEKPVNERVPNGSVFYEIDTGRCYMYDTDNDIWIEQ